MKLTEICGQWKRFDGLLTEFQRCVVLFRIFACVLFTMVENSNVGLRFQRMTCSTPTNPFKPEKPLTPATDSSLDPKVNFQSPIRQIHFANPLASERFVKHFIDAVKDEYDRLRLRRDKPCSMDEASSLACELQAFCLLDGDWRRSSAKVCSADEVVREPHLFESQLEMLCHDIQLHEQRQETQQVALQQLVQQIHQLTRLMSLNMPGSQQSPPASRYSSRCWYCKESGHYLRLFNFFTCDSLPASVKFSLS